MTYKYSLHEVKDDTEWPAVMKALQAGFTDPGTKLWPLFTYDDPTFSPAQRKASLEEATERFRSWHKPDPTSHWLKVVEDSTGEVVGGGRWALYETGNPYEGHGELPATWWPEGEQRDCATKALNDFLGSSCRLMPKPHVFLNILFTHPKYRRQGVGAMIMEWGISHADRLGLEMFIEATPEGKPLYEAFGFKVLEVQQLDVTKANASKEWKEAEMLVTPFKWWSMHRDAKVLSS